MIEAQPSRTALRVALRRAAHQVHDARPLVFDDPLAVRILGREYVREVERTPDAERRPFSAALRAFMVARARLAEDALAARVRGHGVTQYLVLGAGLDTFAYRTPYPSLRVFEVDHPATQAWKRNLLAEAAINEPASVTHVPLNFELQDLKHELRQAGFDFGAPTMTAWLGVVPYLTAEAFRSTIILLGKLAVGSEVIFDYSLPREALSPVEQRMRDSQAERVKLVGEPFQLFFAPEELHAQLEAVGHSVIEDLDGPAMTQRMFAGRSDGLTLRGTSGRVCRAAVT